MTMKSREFDRIIAARFPSRLAAAISDAARAQLMNPSTFVRQAVAEKLRPDGFPFDTLNAPRRAN